MSTSGTELTAIAGRLNSKILICYSARPLLGHHEDDHFKMCATYFMTCHVFLFLIHAIYLNVCISLY